MAMRIETATGETAAGWAKLRHALWPHADPGALAHEAQTLLGRDDAICFVAAEEGRVVAFAEAKLREYANGCESSPVAFVEGLYVDPAWRRRGIARALIARIEAWATARGVRELGSDVLLDNVESQRVHETLGFAETERVVYYRKVLTR